MNLSGINFTMIIHTKNIKEFLVQFIDKKLGYEMIIYAS